MIETRDLVFEYPSKRALDGISLTIERHSITALVGPNGAGKTTLLRCMAALETPYAGRVFIDGLDTREAPRAIHARLGYLPDFFGLYDALSIRRCLSYAARAHGISPIEAKGAAEAVAARVGLSDRMDQLAGTLSRGLRQRLAIAQAIVHRPAVLLLDEPAAGLDPEARQDLSDLLRTLRSEGVTLVVSSHILAELKDYSDRMIILDQGKIAGGEVVSLREANRIRLRIGLAVPNRDLESFLVRQEGVEILKSASDSASILILGDAHSRALLLERLVRAGFPVSDFAEDLRTLEEVYFGKIKPLKSQEHLS